MRRTSRTASTDAWRLWLFLPALVIPLPVQARTVDTTAPIVRAIEIRAATVLDLDQRGELGEILTTEVGLPLDRAEVRRSLRNLQASGLASEVEARTLPDGDGVKLFYLLGRRVRVASVELVGELGLRRSELEPAVLQQEAAPLSESRIVRGVYALQDLLVDRGFSSADVRVDVVLGEGGEDAEVTYRIDAGVRTRVRHLRLEGSLGTLTREELIERLRMSPGEVLRESRLEEDLERLEKVFLDAGYRAAEIDGPRREGELGATQVDLIYQVEAGPHFEISAQGAEIEQLRRRRLLADLENQRYDEALLLQTVRNIRRDFQERGHYRAQVESEVETTDDQTRILFIVQPGPLYELDEVKLEGNSTLTQAQLLPRMVTAADRGLFSGAPRLVDGLLQEDIANLASYYVLQGFHQAEVGPERVEERGSRLAVTIPIVEGPRQRVVEVGIDGVDRRGLGIELESLAVRPGGPFHPRLVEESTEELLARLEDRGYLFAQVQPRLEWNREQTLVTVVFEVLAGPLVTVDRVVIRGGRRTDPRLIRRTLDLHSGEPLSRRSLLEAQRRLYRLGIFSRARVQMAPAPPFSQRRDVLVSISEGSERRLTYGIGYDTEDELRGLFGYSHVNLFGRGVAARFDLRYSGREQQARALLRQPMVGRWAIPVTYSLFGVEEEQKSFDSIRRGFQVEAERRGKTSQAALLYTFKVVEVENADPILQPIEIDRDLAEVEISSLTPSWFVDRRDDLLLPQRGWTLRLQSEYAFPLFGADTEFVKLFTQQTSYVPLGGFGTLASSVRVGAIEPVGSTGVEDPTLPESLTSRLIPISERFFAGGRTTHRAYRRDRLGITGTSLLEVDDPDNPGTLRQVSVGGNGLLLVNLEYRFPIAGALGGTAFFDAGNVWGDWRDVDLSEVKKGAGVGLRYLSPIGPLRLEVGWKLDRETGEDPAVIFLSFGNPF